MAMYMTRSTHDKNMIIKNMIIIFDIDHGIVIDFTNKLNKLNVDPKHNIALFLKPMYRLFLQY